MKKLAILLLVVAFAVTTVPAFAAIKGPSAMALEKASNDSMVDRVGDWVATRGKSPEEAQAIVADRKAKRLAAKAQKELERVQREAEKQKKVMEKELKEQQAKMKKAWGN